MLRILQKFRVNNVFFSRVKPQRKMSTIQEIVAMKNDDKPQDEKKRPLEENGVDEQKPEKIQRTDKTKKKNFALMLGYLGKDYYGMQRNPRVRTIEEDLIGALFRAQLIDQDAFDTIQTINFQRAARTDKGVSATRQICSIKLPDNATPEAINQFLPKEIRVFGLKRVTKGFNSKSQCIARTYSYTLPTFAFASDDPRIVRFKVAPTDEEIEQRLEKISVIDGKPYTEFRMTPELINKVNSVLQVFEGTHNFHNFTAKVRPFDPQAQRFIMKCYCSEPYVSQGMEFTTVIIKGQSFMFHQIRKMMAVAIGVVRNLVPEEIIEECFNPEKRDIPIAPSLGLVLNHVHYDNYNRRYGSDGIHENLLWNECEEEVEKFHKEFILKHIEDSEVNEKSMLIWLADLARHSFADRVNDRKPSVTTEDDNSQATDA